MFESRSIDVGDGALAVGLSGAPSSMARFTVIAVHGITASMMSWAAVARSLADDVAFVAVDLRGRGASASLPGPFGMRAHGDDLSRVIDALGVSTVIAAGHSMGAFVVSALAASRPRRIAAVVLIDGGFPVAIPPGVPHENLVEAIVGPAVSRLSMTFASREQYHEMWRQHPALAGPGRWNDDVEAYLDYDLAGEAPSLRSRVSADAVQTDGLELLVDDDVARSVARVQCPIEIVRVERGLLDEPSPLVPLDSIGIVQAPHRVTTVADLNHYTVMFDPVGATEVARAIERAGELGSRG